jgi:hypothetical protein
VPTARPDSLNLVRAVDPWQLARGIVPSNLGGPPSRVRRSHQKPRTSPRLLARSDTRPSQLATGRLHWLASPTPTTRTAARKDAHDRSSPDRLLGAANAQPQPPARADQRTHATTATPRDFAG